MKNPSAAEKRAISILGDHGVTEAPVPVEEIARALGAELTFDAFDGDISGMLYRDDEKAVIGINSTHATTRQRFTVAHEVGHLVMHKGKPVFIDRFVRVNWRDGQSDREEIEANAFAAELLMPRELMQAEITRVLAKRRQVTPVEVVTSLANRFGVSAEAMQYRMTNLGILDPYSLAG